MDSFSAVLLAKEVAGPSAEPALAQSGDHVVILVHGIRDYALWQSTVRSALEAEGLRVEATNYGRFNLIEFLIPVIHFFRKRAAAKVCKQICMVKQNNPDAHIS